MDVNGTHFHLINGQADWCRCRQEEQPVGVTDWCAAREDGRKAGWLQADWHERSHSLILAPQLSLFPRGARDKPLAPAARRGAAVDRFGNWFWIGHDRQRIYWHPAQARRPQLFWEQTRPAPPRPAGEFGPATPETPAAATLSGLAVTAHHYLVVGNASGRGLFVFDLHASGAPLLLRFPAGIPFAPFDLAAAPGGGVWVLDRAHHAYWGLDRAFRVVSDPSLLQELAPEERSAFRPAGGDVVVRPGRSFPHGFPLAATHDPIAIAALPDGSVLVLDTPAGDGPSALHHYRLEQPLSPPVTLPDLAGVTAGEEARPLVGHDLAFTAGDEAASGRVTVVERDGNQAVAFAVTWADGSLAPDPQPDYLPLHYFGGRALVAHEGKLFYDVVGGATGDDDAVRWVQLHQLDQPRYARTATLTTPIFDGKERDCVWHRILLDACIPPETTVVVWTRAHNDDELLATVPYTREPDLYLRGGGAEIPYYEPFPGDVTRPETTGTWELLCQQAHGRYLQIKLELQGNGRVTPQLHALRAYYPRFSYPRRFLPAVYLQEPESASFLERLLANMEGFYTTIEGLIAEVSVLFDPRSAPPEALDWLAGWLGLVVDPLWSTIQEVRAENDNGNGPYRYANFVPDRRRFLIRYARQLYERRGTPDGIRFALLLLLDPCLEQTWRQFRAAAVRPDHPLHKRLARYGLGPLTTALNEEEMEDLLFQYVLARPSRVRVVERFLTRGGRTLAAGDRPRPGSADTIAATAHRFSVLIPEGLSADEEAMVRRIVKLEKPAHTDFEVRHYWDGFRVGEARLGIDTTLDHESRFPAVVLGRHHLAEGYLAAGYPTTVTERMVPGRDRLGHLPPL